MSAVLLDRPVTPVGGGSDPLHIVCCRDDLALCGDELAGQFIEADDESQRRETCDECQARWDLNIPCGGLLCRLRRRRNSLRVLVGRISHAAGRDIAAPDEPIVQRVAGLLRGRTEATQRALELAAEVADLRDQLEARP